MAEITRRAAPANLAVSEADELFYSWVGMTMTMAKDPRLEAAKRLDLANTASTLYMGFRTRTVALIRAIASEIGMRPRANLFPAAADGFELIADLGIALSEGASVRTRFDKEELPDIELLTGPDGESQTWTAFAAGYWALLNTFLEVDPDAEPAVRDDD